MEPDEIKEQDQMFEAGAVGPEVAEDIDPGTLAYMQAEEEKEQSIRQEERTKYLIRKLAHLQAVFTLAIIEFELETGEKIEDIIIGRQDAGLTQRYSWSSDLGTKATGVAKDRVESVRVVLKKEGE